MLKSMKRKGLVALSSVCVIATPLALFADISFPAELGEGEYESNTILYESELHSGAMHSNRQGMRSGGEYGNKYAHCNGKLGVGGQCSKQYGCSHSNTLSVHQMRGMLPDRSGVYVGVRYWVNVWDQISKFYDFAEDVGGVKSGFILGKLQKDKSSSALFSSAKIYEPKYARSYFNGGLAVGYMAYNGLSFEVEGSYNSTDVDTEDYLTDEDAYFFEVNRATPQIGVKDALWSDVPTDAPLSLANPRVSTVGAKLSGNEQYALQFKHDSIKVLSLLGGLVYRFMGDQFITPFVGLSGGLARMKLLEKSYNRFGFQLRGGVNFYVTDGLSFSLGYRYFSIPNGKVDEVEPVKGIPAFAGDSSKKLNARPASTTVHGKIDYAVHGLEVALTYGGIA